MIMLHSIESNDQHDHKPFYMKQLRTTNMPFNINVDPKWSVYRFPTAIYAAPLRVPLELLIEPLGDHRFI